MSLNSKIRYIFIIVTFILVACSPSSDKNDDLEKGLEINFQLYEKAQDISLNSPVTRGPLLSNDLIYEMGVFASRSVGEFNPDEDILNYMYNQKVVRENAQSEWYYTPLKYWPLSGQVSFFAYAPYVDDGNTMLTFSPKSQAGKPTFNYDMSPSIADQIDLLVAEPVMNKTEGQINFKFKHYLSCVEFSARKADNFPEDVEMRVMEIEVNGLRTSGSLQYVNSGYGWELNPDKSTSFLLSVENGILASVDLKNENQLITLSDKFMPIPQSFTGKIQLIIRAEYRKGAEKKEVSFEQNMNNFLSSLEMGKRYTLSLILNVTEIRVEYSIKEWYNHKIDIPTFD
ncbi:MAG: fimbrillin family protein [Bacteroidales bacterium]